MDPEFRKLCTSWMFSPKHSERCFFWCELDWQNGALLFFASFGSNRAQLSRNPLSIRLLSSPPSGQKGRTVHVQHQSNEHHPLVLANVRIWWPSEARLVLRSNDPRAQRASGPGSLRALALAEHLGLPCHGTAGCHSAMKGRNCPTRRDSESSAGPRGQGGGFGGEGLEVCSSWHVDRGELFKRSSQAGGWEMQELLRTLIGLVEQISQGLTLNGHGGHCTVSLHLDARGAQSFL